METSNLVGGFDSNKGKQHTWRSLKQDPFSQIGMNMKHIWTSSHWELFTTWKLDSASQKKNKCSK